jgi:RecG-like helicase
VEKQILFGFDFKFVTFAGAHDQHRFGVAQPRSTVKVLRPAVEVQSMRAASICRMVAIHLIAACAHSAGAGGSF